MQTLKLFMTLLKRNMSSVIIYLVIFAIITVMTAKNGSSTEAQMYNDKKINFTVFNRDDSTFGENITEYLSGINKYVEVEDDLEVLKNELYYRGVYYALVIPEGFEEALLSEDTADDIALSNYKITDSSMGYYMDMAVDEYVSILKAYMAAGCDYESALERTAATLAETVEVSVISQTSSDTPPIYGFYQVLPYIFLAMVIGALGNVMLAFNREKVRIRSMCSSLRLSSRNMQIALGTVITGIMMWMLFEIIAVVVYGSSVSAMVYVFTGLNSLCFMIVSVSLSVIFGYIAGKETILSAITTIVSLGASFLSGVFVPLEFLGDGIINIAKFLPSYWYITANSAILEAGENVKMTSEIAGGMAIQLLFAAAFFAVAMVASKHTKRA